MMRANQPGTFGRQLRSFEVNGFLFTESEYQAHTVLARHAHDLASINFILDGVYCEDVDRTTGAYTPMELVFKPPREMHANRFSGLGARSLLIEAPQERVAALGPQASILSTNAHLRTPRLTGIASHLYREFRELDDFSLLSIEGLTLELLAVASRAAHSRTPDLVREATDLIHDSFRTSLTLSGVASKVGAHPSHLARSFRGHHGCTVGDYLRRLRVEYVADRLTASDDPVAAISLDAGFADQSHCTRTFKKYFGQTPAQYRWVRLGRKGRSSAH